MTLNVSSISVVLAGNGSTLTILATVHCCPKSIVAAIVPVYVALSIYYSGRFLLIQPIAARVSSTQSLVVRG